MVRLAIPFSTDRSVRFPAASAIMRWKSASQTMAFSGSSSASRKYSRHVRSSRMASGVARWAAKAAAEGSRIRRISKISCSTSACMRIHCEGDAIEQEFGLQAGDVGAITSADVQDSSVHKSANSLTEGVARRPEQLSEHVLRRDLCPRRQFARYNQSLYPLDAVLDSRSGHWAPTDECAANEAGLGAAKPRPAGSRVGEVPSKHPPSKLGKPIAAVSAHSLTTAAGGFVEMGGVVVKYRMFPAKRQRRQRLAVTGTRASILCQGKSVSASYNGISGPAPKYGACSSCRRLSLDSLATVQISYVAVCRASQTWDDYPRAIGLLRAAAELVP